MKFKVLSALIAVGLFACLLTIMQQQQTEASSTLARIAIIGGVMHANETSHITIQTVPGSRSGMVIFYRCNGTGLVRTVYPNYNATVLGRYTWQWLAGAPCQRGGFAVVRVNSHVGGTYITAQKTFQIASLVQPTPTLTPVPTTGLGVNGNPWGYDFTIGNLIYQPPSTFCDQYFSCVSSFWTSTNGYVAECNNGLYTHSGGVRGACSKDGGVERILYSH